MDVKFSDFYIDQDVYYQAFKGKVRKLEADTESVIIEFNESIYFPVGGKIMSIIDGKDYSDKGIRTVDKYFIFNKDIKSFNTLRFKYQRHSVGIPTKYKNITEDNLADVLLNSGFLKHNLKEDTYLYVGLHISHVVMISETMYIYKMMVNNVTTNSIQTADLKELIKFIEARVHLNKIVDYLPFKSWWSNFKQCNNITNFDVDFDAQLSSLIPDQNRYTELVGNVNANGKALVIRGRILDSWTNNFKARYCIFVCTNIIRTFKLNDSEEEINVSKFSKDPV